MASNQGIDSFTHKYVYSKQELLALQSKASKSFDFGFLKDPELKDLKPHRRGKRGGVRLAPAIQGGQQHPVPVLPISHTVYSLL